MIRKEDNMYVVYDKSGRKKLGSHPSKAKALDQLAAIEISKKRGK